MGYHRAGFDVVGVDHKPQPRYPFTFVQGDALRPPFDLRDFDAIHASPPCQHYTVAASIHDSAADHPDLVAACRDLLEESGVPWVMENVPNSPLRNAITLCGTMFDLKVFRHRIFESNVVLFSPEHKTHKGRTAPRGSYSTSALSMGGYITVAGNNFIREEGAAAMGIDWPMTRKEIANAIPPAYTQFVGKQLMRVVLAARETEVPPT